MWSLSTLCVVAWKSSSWQRPCFRYLRYSTSWKFWVPCFKVQPPWYLRCVHWVLVLNWNQSHKIIDDYSLCASKLDVILLSMWKISQLKISCWLSAVFVVALPSQQYHGWTFNEIIRYHRKLVSNPPPPPCIGSSEFINTKSVVLAGRNASCLILYSCWCYIIVLKSMFT